MKADTIESPTFLVFIVSNTMPFNTVYLLLVLNLVPGVE